MPVCTRDVGIFLGITIGAAIFSLRGLNRWTVRDTFLSVFPDEKVESLYLKDRRMAAMLILVALGLVPMGIDGFTQLLTNYESTNIVRLLTGSTMGAAIAWLIAATICARGSDFDDAGEVVLPAGSRLKIR